MNIEELRNHIDFIQARIEETERLVINANPSDKGYKELVDSYNKYIDRYNELMTQLEHFDDVDIDKAKLDFEIERFKTEEEIERDKIDLDRERLRLDREKFAYDVEHQKSRELLSDILEVAEVTGKILVPIAGLTGVIYVANLAYMNDSKLELCNGRVIGGVKDLLKIITLKVH